MSDLVSENDRIKAFSRLRISTNLAWALGPSVGGLLITGISHSFTFLVSSVIFLIMSFYVNYFFMKSKMMLEGIDSL